MSILVFDIETAPVSDEELPPSWRRKLEESSSDDSWRETLGLYAPSASVITIGMLDTATGTTSALYDDRHGALSALDPPYHEVRLEGGDEAHLLGKFWRRAAGYEKVATYNGRRFDVPLLMQRSLVRNVTVDVDLMAGERHLDLAERLRLRGATRPYGLSVWTEAIGETSPKDGGLDGSGVAAAFASGKTREIVTYCMRDVEATARLASRVAASWPPSWGA